MAGLACCIWGIYASQRLMRRTGDLRLWLDALESMQTQCSCLRLTPKEVLQNALGKQAAEPAQYLLTREEQAVINACLQSVMNDTKEQQERQLQYAIRRFETARVQAEKRQMQDAKLFVSLGVLGGLCVFLLCV